MILFLIYRKECNWMTTTVFFVEYFHIPKSSFTSIHFFIFMGLLAVLMFFKTIDGLAVNLSVTSHPRSRVRTLYWAMTMFLHMTPELVGASEQTRE